MIQAVANDYKSLDYSTATAAGVMEVLVLLSSDSKALAADSQVGDSPPGK